MQLPAENALKISMRPGCSRLGGPGIGASDGNRTRIPGLEGRYPDRWTTDAHQKTAGGSVSLPPAAFDGTIVSRFFGSGVQTFPLQAKARSFSRPSE